MQRTLPFEQSNFSIYESGYDIIDDYFDFIVPSFMDLYKIDLLDEEQDPPYPKFLLLLGGLHDTSLNKIIEMRLETDNKILEHYNAQQKKEWDRWQSKKYDTEMPKKELTLEDYKKAYGIVDKIF